MSVQDIPTKEMLVDRDETVQDIKWCDMALAVGVTTYGGENHDEKSVQERLDTNKKILEVIDGELKRRGIIYLGGVPIDTTAV